jgi:uncharacterized membrane protein YebE (DUF533 family)
MDVELGRDTLLALAAMAWADGKLEAREAAGIRAAAGQLGLAAEELTELEQALQEPVGMDAVETVRMTRLTRLFTYAAATWIAHIDNRMVVQEREALDTLGDRLGLSKYARQRAEAVALGLRAAQAKEGPAEYDLVKLKSRLSAALSQISDE